MLWHRKLKTDDLLNKRLIDIIRDIQQGNNELKNDLIKRYSPFIMKIISNVCKRYISEDDDEFSIGLLAFNDAIDKFNVQKGTSFVSFAKVVISNRVIDYIRMNQKDYIEITIDAVTSSEMMNAEINSSLIQYREKLLAHHIAEEIDLYSKKLKKYNMSFEELARICPKHSDTRKNAAQVAKLIVDNPEFKDTLLNKKQLPTKKLLEQVSLSRKTLERNRKYIIAIAVLLDSDFDFLKQFLSF